MRLLCEQKPDKYENLSQNEETPSQGKEEQQILFATAPPDEKVRISVDIVTTNNDNNLDNLISVNTKYCHVKLDCISLYSSYFVQTSFQKCIFKNVDFINSNLNNTIFKCCSFISLSFACSEIMGAKITTCKFTDIIFIDNEINDTQFEISDKFYSAINDNIEENVVGIFD